VRLGIVTPVLTRLPRAHAEWEARAGIDTVERVVVAAERLGYEFATCSEHVAIPAEVATTRGATYGDPLATFGYLAAHTTTIHFATFVLVLGYHHPLAIAKRYGTLDRICAGRLILGVGVGSLEEEFALLDASFEDRGARGDDAVRAVRAAFGVAEPAYRGSHYTFDGFVVDLTAYNGRRPSGSVVALAARFVARSSSPMAGRRSRSGPQPWACSSSRPAAPTPGPGARPRSRLSCNRCRPWIPSVRRTGPAPRSTSTVPRVRPPWPCGSCITPPTITWSNSPRWSRSSPRDCQVVMMARA
jgi:hypothetical protein